MSSSNVDKIKSKIDIVSLVGSYMKLEKAGSNFKGKCPFHNEKTPSFFVSPDRGAYYCFGCQAKGDIFTFVQEFEGLDFMGALKVLADRAGVVLEFGERVERSEKDKLFEILEQAVFFFQKSLRENKSALEYLKNRSVSEETIKNFRIGFAPMEWRTLMDFLKSKGVSEKNMIEVGLLKTKDGTDKHYDTFRGRIMFPISDSSGRVAGFSGRILVDDGKSPKYLNSPETQLFNKSEILFGLDKAKKDIRLRDYSVLVEGQMDLVMLHQAGITNTVASSGTALTPEHMVRLRRLSNRIIMAYDGDSAGFNASSRSARIALSLGMELKLAEMPEGKDPADLAKENPEELKKRLKEAKHIIDFYTDVLLTKNLSSRDTAMEIQKNVLPFVAELPSSIEKSHFIKSIAQKTLIKEDALWEDLKRINLKEANVEKGGEQIPTISRINSIERKLAGLVLWQEESGNPIIDPLELKEKIGNVIGGNVENLIKKFEKEKISLLFETESYYSGKTDLEKDIAELISGLEEEYLKNKFLESMSLLQDAERARDSAKVLEYLEECQNISQKINNIKNLRSH